MSKRNLASLLVVGAMAVVAAVGQGCVAQRPSRNGVFNENQYIRKEFLVRAADAAADNGWYFKATVLDSSQPNPLGGAYIAAGLESGGFHGIPLVRFRVTQDHLQMLSMREMSPNDKTLARTEQVAFSWPVTNVDLKYRVNLDGEKTNFYEENQELDWQVRQWVKINPAKADISHFANFGSFVHEFLDMCTDMANAAATLLPETFAVHYDQGYMQWVVNVTVPLRIYDDVCRTWYAYSGYGDQMVNFDLLDRQNMSFNILYSFARAKAIDPNDPAAYQPLVLHEKDPIQRKYGPIQIIGAGRDAGSQLVAGRQMVTRYDPNKEIVWYFEDGFPAEYKSFFTDKDGIGDQTNKLFEEIGVKARVKFLEWNHGGVARHYGDVRYNFQRWMSSLETGNGYLGGTMIQADPRTGEIVSTSINYVDFPEQDYLVHRIDAYLKTVGATADIDSAEEWPDPPRADLSSACKDGDTVPVVPEVIEKNHNGQSSLYARMQQYLGRPVDKEGKKLGPKDFIVQQDDDFMKAYFAVAPYFVYSDPDMNPYVVREGGAGVYSPTTDLTTLWDMSRKEAQFHRLAAKVDRGETPYDGMTGPDGLKNALEFLNKTRSFMLNHRKLEHLRQGMHFAKHDPPEMVSLESVTARNARRCVKGKWETKAEWVKSIITNYWKLVMWHEFGHALGLSHNFMASVDRPNWPTYTDSQGKTQYQYYSSSVMDYTVTADRMLYGGGWGPYDKAALAWIYANNGGTLIGAQSNAISGQSWRDGKAYPWKDPKGFDATGKEIQYLYCDERHLQYTPLCRQFDLGATPSEIAANDIDSYEWQYHWRNFRQYRKFWNNAYYANAPVGLILDMRRFLSLWAFDWGSGNLYDLFRRIGLHPPPEITSSVQYYSQLTDKFNKEASTANQMAAAFHKAVIQQSSGERPYRTIYDPYYGDTTQQGIILDKLFAMIGWVGLWPTDNYDQNQAGFYISSYSSLGDYSYSVTAEDTVMSMIGGQYDVYPYFVPFAVSLFAQDTHSPAFNGRIEVRDWIGGFVFNRQQDFLDYFRQMAIDFKEPGCVGGDLETCHYDPRPLSDRHNEFTGPDKRMWIWAYVQDRNQWVAVRKDRNVAAYVILRNYNDYVVYQLDDGHYPGGAYPTLLPVKYFLDSFHYFN
jgi:hypothetical protein